MLHIFTDTSSNLTVELLKKYDLHQLSFKLSVNNIPMEYPKEEDFDGAAFYGSMRKGAVVSTSLVNVGDFLDAFRPLLSAGDDILYVGMSGGISGTANSAQAAVQELKEEFPDRKIVAIDTYAASLGEGLQVIEAAKMHAAGKTIDEIEAYLKESRKTICQFFTVDDLMYLKRGGRISGASAAIGNILNIKPILIGDDTGHIVLSSKVKGMKMAMRHIAARFAELCADMTETIGIAHADNPEDADRLLTLLREKGFKGECITVMYEAVTGSHVGPGTVALFYNGIRKY